MKIGCLINPVAGMGGKVALKGTDGEETLRRALELGAVPMASERASSAVKEFASLSCSGHKFFAPSGKMGADLLRSYGFDVEPVYTAPSHTTSDDTKNAVSAIISHDVDLIIFAGGDGTARDVCSVAGTKVPAVGIPAGVKIHSGVYAKRPKDAGKLIFSVLSGNVTRYIETEVVDIDEEAFRNNIVTARLYGYMIVPDDTRFMQERKSGGGAGNKSDTLDLAAYTISQMKQDHMYLIGSGTTTAAVTERLGIDGTLLGVDAVSNGELIAKDMTESDIKKLLLSYDESKRHLIITVIGGQGHIFGRGNQQLSPDVIRMIPKTNIMVIATPIKMSQLFAKPLLADTGDASLDEDLKGYIPVTTGIGRSIMTKVE